MPDKQVEEGKFFAVISYISFLCIISLLFKKDNDFALYHAKLGLVLFVLEVAAFLLSILPFLGWLKIAAVVAFFLVSLWGILLALQGSTQRIPLLSEIADKVIL